LEHLYCELQAELAGIAAPAKVEIISLQIFGGLAGDDLLFFRRKRDAQCLRDAAGDFMLHFENVFEFPIVALSPARLAGGPLRLAVGQRYCVWRGGRQVSGGTRAARRRGGGAAGFGVSRDSLQVGAESSSRRAPQSGALLERLAENVFHRNAQARVYLLRRRW